MKQVRKIYRLPLREKTRRWRHSCGNAGNRKENYMEMNERMEQLEKKNSMVGKIEGRR